MFTKLRNKFLILNMSMTSLVMIAAFAVVYFVTYSNIHGEIQNRLNAQSSKQVTLEDGGPAPEIDPDKPPAFVRHVSSEGPASFDIEVDASGRILAVNSFIDMPDEVYAQAAALAWSQPNSHEAVTLEGRKWRYAVKPMSHQVIRGDGQQYTVLEDKYSLMFLDVTDAYRTLFQLLMTLLAVGLGMLLILLATSLLFANRAIQPIAAAWEKQKQFIADASHELKTPISIMNANYDVLMAHQEETIGSQLKWLGYLKIGTDRMTRLANDLLTLAKLEDAQLEVRKQPFDLSAAVQETVASMEKLAMDKNIRLRQHVEPGLIALGDADKAKQVVAILLDNAIKYADANGRIDLSLTKSKRRAAFSITNSGPGIAADDLPKVFDRFFRADRSRTHDAGGFGLGLSIARTITEQLGGEIHARSVEGEYTTFTFSLGIAPRSP